MYFDLPPSALSMLIPLYNSPQRYYHNLGHIYFSLSKLDEYYNAVNMPYEDITATTLSIWFHDSVYSPFKWSNTSNEKESALLFKTWHDQTILPLKFTKNEKNTWDSIYQKVIEAILATEYHLGFPDEYVVSHDTTYIMLDVDMAGFARSFNEVYKDSEKIFKEYEALGLPEKVMLNNRIAFLEALLAKERIYHTQYFYDTHEQAARNNIEAVIEASKVELDK